jgi:hypothetical protein
MFKAERSNSTLGSSFALFELIFHSTVRSIRKSHGNAIIGLLMNMMQTVILVVTFYIMFNVLGMRGNTVRGDFLLYIMSGIFLFMTHSKAMGAVMSAEGPTSAMMKHAPMSTAVSITSAALGALYIHLSRRVPADRDRRSCWRVWDGASLVVYRGRDWLGVHGRQALGTGADRDHLPSLLPREYDRLGEDVPCEQPAA